MEVTPPTKLSAEHDLTAFSCGVPDLDKWLKERAWTSARSGAAHTYVLCAKHHPNRVVAFYCLSTGSILRVEAPGRVRRNMPEPIPVLLLGRLAVHTDWSGQGVGQALLRDAILRCLQVADIVGVRCLLVHAISMEAVKYYKKLGFIESPLSDTTLMLPIETARSALEVS